MDNKTDNKVDNKKEASYLTITLTSAVLRVLGCFLGVLILLPLGILQWICSVLHSFFKTTEDWLDGFHDLSESIISFGVIKKYYDAMGEIDRLERIIRNPVAYELSWDDNGNGNWSTGIVLTERFQIRKDEDMFSPTENKESGFSLYYGSVLLKSGIQSVDDAKRYTRVWLERFYKETINTEDRIIFGRKHYR